ncbi:2,5-diketo-D-gluconate reductase B [Halogranum rubrum]|uniref:2,5-diketo-D-gluconate reductase B n=1 Tax=Halogranum rubrum TaxID=553466 RepID=A0A1I4BLB7_9EURY|nr:aldo/keto reductase [Halogranum rubrum]SFK68997.1 2,5-diketo-D-gluconate reductase B [Halogranum rubrum]
MPHTALPRLGFGTVGVTDPETIETALEIGYRHIDTAQWYENETIVGRGIARSSVPREELTVATKVLPDNLGAEDLKHSTEQSLDRLGLDTVDLLYVHWPTNAYDPVETLGAFDDLYDDGKLRYVGLSNFTPSLLDEAREILDAPILATQVEMHPLLPQRELVEYVQRTDIYLVAYSPLAQGKVFDEPVLGDIADKYGVSVAQVSLAWLFSHDNVAAIPKASGDHIRDNYEALSLDLNDEDIARIDAIDHQIRTVNPETEEKVDRTPWTE